VTAIAERAALSVENSRLLQDAQKRAAKERTIGEISARIGNLVDLDNILQTTIQELSRNMPDAEVAIQFHRKQG
jgi:GAF domain-containing protein